MNKVKPNSLVVGLTVIVSTLLLLYFAPLLLTKRSFSFPTTSQTAEAQKMLSEEAKRIPLKVIFAPNEVSLSKEKKRPSSISLEELLKNTPHGIIVNFWATWCPPCVEEFPSLVYLGNELPHSPSSPLLIALSVDEKIPEVTKFFQSLDYVPSFVVLHDRDGSVARSLGTMKFPETYFFNSQGAILYKWIGPQEWLSKETLETIRHHTIH